MKPATAHAADHVLLEHDAPNRYYDSHLKREAVKLMPGEYFATQADVAIVTVLGSCVSACLRDPRTGVGGMNHFMLPRGFEDSTPVSTSARYGIHAMELLINRLVKLGAGRAHLEAKVFGGGNVMRGFTVLNIGEANANFVEGYLRAEGIRIVADDLLGESPRKVYFFPKTGRALVREIRRLHNPTLLEREAEYDERLRELPRGGQIEIFK